MKKGLIKPQWAKAQERRAGDSEIVETPLVSNRSVIFKDTETLDNKSEVSPKKIYNVSRLIVQKNLKTGDIRSFIMIIRGSYNYLKEKRQLDKNNFFHIEPDFEGDVYFYELEQGLMNGYRYKAGKIASTITLGMEEDNAKTRANGPNVTENCHIEKIMVEVGRSCQTYTDEEFGFPIEVCEVFYSPEFILVCDDKPEITPPGEPDIDWDPNPNPPRPRPLPASCAKSDEMSNDNIFMNRIYTMYEAACSIDEESLRNMLSRSDYAMEWLGWTDRYHYEIHPTTYDGNGRRWLFREQDLEGKVFDEWYHIQAKPGIGIPLLEDLKELGELFNKGRINVDKFTYGIVSSYGCLSLMVTGGAFEFFSNKLKYGKLDVKYNQCIQEGYGKPEKERIGLFIKFLEDNDAGLNVIFAYPDHYSMNAFWSQMIDEHNNMMDNPCIQQYY